MCSLSSNKRFSLFSEALHNKWFVEFISIRKIIISCSWIIQLLFSHQCVKKTRGCHRIRSSQHNCGSRYYHDIYINKQIQNGSINSIFNSDYFVFCLFFGKLITLKIWVEGGRKRVCNLDKKENKMCLERQIIVNHSVHSGNQMKSQQKMQKAETSSLSSRVVHTSSVFHFVMSQLSWILWHFYFMH